jgi:hypothetical protein
VSLFFFIDGFSRSQYVSNALHAFLTQFLPQPINDPDTEGGHLVLFEPMVILECPEAQLRLGKVALLDEVRL